jgi:hypothetical protein
MNFTALVLHGLRAIMVFAEDTFVRVGTACAAIVTLSTVGALAATGLKFSALSTPGWFSLAIGVLFLIFLQAIAVSIISLMALMLTGIIRSNELSARNNHLDCISDIIFTEGIS